MAIAPFLPGVTASILIANTPAHEHPDLDEPSIQHPDPSVSKYQTAHLISKYIESVTDSEFTIKLTLGPPYSKTMDSKVRFHIKLDGIPVWISTAARPRVRENGGEWEEVVEGVKEGKGRGCVVRKFRFAEIKTNSESLEPAKVKRLAQRLLPLGAIEIKVYREDYGKQGGPTPGTTKGFQRPNEVIPEKALKGDAKSHGTVLGNAKKVARGEVWRTKKKDGEDYPLAIFRFMYRSKDGTTEALKQLQIIPRTPSPSPSRSPSPELQEEDNEDEEVTADNLTPSQRRQFEALMASFAKENKSRKGGSASAGSKRKATRIKKEHVEERGGRGRAAKRARREEGPVMVDLTGDDEEDDGNELFVRGRAVRGGDDEWAL